MTYTELNHVLFHAQGGQLHLKPHEFKGFCGHMNVLKLSIAHQNWIINGANHGDQGVDIHGVSVTDLQGACTSELNNNTYVLF